MLSRPVSLSGRALFWAHGRDPRRYHLIMQRSPHCEYHMIDEWAEKHLGADAPGATSAGLRSL